MHCARSTLALVLACVAIGCSGGSNVAKPPAYEPKDQAKCTVRKSPSEPLVVEWPSSARAKLEALAQRSLVAVRYEGCEMELLPSCSATGTYTYRPLTRKQDRLTIATEDELYANLPLGAVHLEGALQKSGSLGVDMTIVGRWQSEGAPGALRGDCARATHIVTALTTGAFRFFAGADSMVRGGAGVPAVSAGGKTTSKNELIARDGDEQACSASTQSDVSPPFGCGAILRLDVVPVSGQATSTASTDCPQGASWDGARCVVTAVSCPAGSTWNGSSCVGAATTPATPAAAASDGFYCYRIEKKSGNPRISSTCMGTKVSCEEGRAHDAKVPDAKGVTACEKRSTASCFTLRRTLHCYEAFGECSAIAEVWQPNDGCDNYRSYEGPAVR